MHIHVYERIVLGLTIVLLVVAMGAIGSSVFASHIHLPSPAGKIDPTKVRQTPPFDQPGVSQVAPGRYEAVMIGQTWSFVPNEIRVPVGSTVTFLVASADVTHGFNVEGTNVNIMLIPGHVAESTTTFRNRGTFLILCHEYCGAQHHAMYGKVVVE